jgi:uncharacterized membrane protein
MAELHPFFVHFPIALLLAAMIFDLLGILRKQHSFTTSAFLLQILAALSAILAGFSGHLAESHVVDQDKLSEAIHPALTAHVGWGNTMVWIIVIFVLARTFAILEKKSWAQQGWLFPLASSFLSILVIYTGLLGGKLGSAILSYFTLN